VRVIACLDELPNLACSTQEGTLSSNEWTRVAKACGVAAETPVLVVWGGAEDVATACREIVGRAREATQGVPSETRQLLDDGTNGFERILPGPDRMYPDTDLPPVRVDEARLRAIAAALPEPPWRRRERLAALGVGEDLAERLSRHAAWPLYARLAARLGDGARLTAHQLASLLLDRRCARPADPVADAAWWERTVDRLARGEILVEGVAAGAEDPPAPVDGAEARRLVLAAVAAMPVAGPAATAKRVDWAMGPVMRAVRGRVPGRLAHELVKEARP